MAASPPLGNSTIGDATATASGNELWDQFNKIYSKNEKAIDKCMKTDVRSIARGDKVSDIELQIDTFSETTRVVLDALAGLGKIHPMIGAAVVAFHAVISLDMSRRDNDKKVIAIMLEMQNMMCAMLQMRLLKDTNVQDGEMNQEKSRLHALIDQIAADIIQCGSDLNYYLGQKFAFKLIKAKNFERVFKTHVENFATRRSELQSAIAAYVAGGVDQANLTLTEMSTQVAAVDSKMDYMFHTFLRKLDTPREKEVFVFFEQNNGVEHCIAKDDLLARLLTMTGNVIPDSKNLTVMRSEEKLKESRKVLTTEVRLNFEESLRQNTLRFERLLAIQNNNHERVIARLEKHEGYHMAAASKLDKMWYYIHPPINLSDNEVRRIWEQMGLKRNVNAKKFVLTFRDHYQEDRSELASPKRATSMSPAPLANSAASLTFTMGPDQPARSSTEDPDAWLLEYIDVAHARPIVEAIDADGSGFISVKEISAFAKARPNEWSLLQWMAYWAAGWHINITQYRDKIYGILVDMHELLPSIHPANSIYVNLYLGSAAIDMVEGILRSTNSVTDGPGSQIAELAQFYADIQENALRANLEEASYVISSPADAALVAGRTRAESWIYPLLYLLLERHLAVMKLGQTKIFNHSEMFTHFASLASVLSVFEQRTEALVAMFLPVYQNVDSCFETFAYGMFYSSYKKDTELLPSKSTLVKTRTIRSTRELVLEMRDQCHETVAPADTTMFAHETASSFEFEAFDIHSGHRESGHSPHPIEGYWSFTCFSDESFSPRLGLAHFVLSVAPDGAVTGSGEAYAGLLKLTGTLEPSGSSYSLELRIVIEPPGKFDYLLHGTHNPDRDTVTGTWEEAKARATNDSDAASAVADTPNIPQEHAVAAPPDLNAATPSGEAAVGELGHAESEPQPVQNFFMRRTPADMRQFRRGLNLDNEIDTKVLARNRWRFALDAVKFQVRAKNMSWEYIRTRFAERRLWIDLAISYWHGQISSERNDMMCSLTGLYSLSQSRLYEIIAKYLDHREYEFRTGEVFCDHCGLDIVGVRYRCITCTKEDMTNQMDLCSGSPECIESVSSNALLDFLHSPSHTLLRQTSYLHKIHLPIFIPRCRARSETIKGRFQKLEESKQAAKKPAKGAKSGKLSRASYMAEEPSVDPLLCICCGKEVSLPCWICAQCVVDSPICMECERAKAKIVKFEERASMHSHNHFLLRISDSMEVPPREVNNVRLHRELIHIQTNLGSLEQKVTTHLRSSRQVSTLLKKYLLESEGAPTAAKSLDDVPIGNGVPATTTVAHGEDAAMDEDIEDNDSDDLINTLQVGSICSTDTDGEALVASPLAAKPQSQTPRPPLIFAQFSQPLTDATIYPDVPGVLAAENSASAKGHPQALQAEDFSLLASQSSQREERLLGIDAHISTFESSLESRMSSMENRMSGLENQLGEILLLLRQSHS